jgi:hypothetical protein
MNGAVLVILKRRANWDVRHEVRRRLAESSLRGEVYPLQDGRYGYGFKFISRCPTTQQLTELERIKGVKRVDVKFWSDPRGKGWRRPIFSLTQAVRRLPW